MTRLARRAGSPQASTAPSGGSAFHAVKSLEALFFNEVAARGRGPANLLAAVQGGITRLDGGPYALGSSGNVSSEDAAQRLDAMGCDSGIKRPPLLAVARLMPQIVGHDVPGQVAKAGRITDRHPPPDFAAGLREAHA